MSRNSGTAAAVTTPHPPELDEDRPIGGLPSLQSAEPELVAADPQAVQDLNRERAILSDRARREVDQLNARIRSEPSIAHERSPLRARYLEEAFSLYVKYLVDIPDQPLPKRLRG